MHNGIKCSYIMSAEGRSCTMDNYRQVSEAAVETGVHGLVHTKP